MFKMPFTMAEKTSYQLPTVARTPKMPLRVDVVKCPAEFVTFFALNEFCRISAGWDSMAILILAFHVYLTVILCMAGLHIQVGNDAQLQAQILFQNV